MPFCPQCGVENPDAARFCDQCGATLIPVNAPPVAVAPVAPAAPIAPAAPAAATGATIMAGPSSCPQCGTAVIPGEAFCDNCGASLLGVPVAAPAAAPSPPFGGVPAQPSYPAPQPINTAPPAQPVYSTPAPQPIVTPPIVTPPVVTPPVPVAPSRSSLSGVNLMIMPSGPSLSLPASGQAVIGRADPVSNVFPEIDLMPHGALERGVGRRHARIFLQGGQILVEDQDSTNGTFVNNTRLSPRQPTALKSGDELRLGNLLMRVMF